MTQIHTTQWSKGLGFKCTTAQTTCSHSADLPRFGPITALHTEKGDITIGRAVIYPRFTSITYNVGSALPPSNSYSSFRSQLLGDFYRPLGLPSWGSCLWPVHLTNLVPVYLSSLAPLKLHQSRTASVCSLLRPEHQMHCCSHIAEHCMAEKVNTPMSSGITRKGTMLRGRNLIALIKIKFENMT